MAGNPASDGSGAVAATLATVFLTAERFVGRCWDWGAGRGRVGVAGLRTLDG